MNRQTSSGIGDVKVHTAPLIEILKKNRDKHRAIYEQALVRFREQAITKLDALIAEVKAGGKPNLWVQLPVPEEHTDDYDRAIRMLEMHTEDVIELSEFAYARLVDDEWGWRETFLANSASYL